MVGTGRRALAGTVAGGVWVAWGLNMAHAVAGPGMLACVVIASVLVIGCVYFVVKGRSLRKKYPFARRPLNRGFLLVTALEAAGVVGVISAAQRMGRLDALPDWIGVVIGLHFFGLGRVFRAPVYYVTGAAITLWCVLAWVLLRGNAQGSALGIGVGGILWAATSFNLARVLRRQAAG